MDLVGKLPPVLSGNTSLEQVNSGMLSAVEQKMRTAKSSRNRVAIYIPALKRGEQVALFHFEVKVG